MTENMVSAPSLPMLSLVMETWHCSKLFAHKTSVLRVTLTYPWLSIRPLL